MTGKFWGAALLALAACGGATLGCGSSNTGFTPIGDSGPPDVVEASPTDGNTGNNQLASPTFTPPTGTTFQGSGQVTISGPTGATICYTTDGTLPNPTACKAYTGPIQVTTSETITALATETGFIASPAVQATYTVTAGEGGTGGLTFNPPAGSQFNDFLVQLSGASGDTFCYTLDGSAPSCAAGGQCGGTSQLYSSTKGGISINGTVTDPNTGKVTVTAIECAAGQPVGTAASQAYQLVVATPTMSLNGTVVPPTSGLSNILWPTGLPGLTPIVQTSTVDSSVVTDNVFIVYSTGSAAPTCSSTPQIPSPTIFNGLASSSNPILASNTTYQVVGCKTGYAASTAVTFPFTIELAAPTLPPATAPYPSVPTITIGDAANSEGGSVQADTLCITSTPGTTGTTPTCGAAGGCGANSTSAATFQPGNATSPSTTVEAIACPPTTNPNLNPSAATSPVTYTLQLAQPFLASGDSVGGSQGLPGWGFHTGGNGLPTTSFSIPPVAGTPYPVSDTTCSAHDSQGTPHCVWQIGQVQPVPACAGNEFYPTGVALPSGCTPSTPATYYCYTTAANGTPGCGTTAGTCTGGATAITAVTGAGPAAPTNLVLAGVATAGLDASPATPDTLSLIACPNPSATVVFAASQPTNIGPVTAAGAATQPSVTPVGGAQTTQAVVSVANADPNPSLVCFTVDGTTPTCSLAGGKATCGGSGTTWCGQNGGPPLSGAATCTSTVATSVLASNASFTVPSVLTGTNNEFLQANGTIGSTLNAIACNLLESPSSVNTQAYTFTMAAPDYGIVPQVNGSPGDTTYDTAPAAPIGGGTPIWLSTVSNFDFDSTTYQAISIHWAWNATPTCTTTATSCPTGGLNCGSASPGSFTVNTKTNQVVSNWSQTSTGTAQGFTTVPTPPTGTTATLEAIACGETAALQTTSKVSQVTFTVQPATPVLITNQNCVGSAALCGTTGCNVSQFPVAVASGGTAAQLELQEGNVCPAVSTWQRVIKFQIADATAFATLCYTTDGATPTCSGGTCGAGTQHVTDTTGTGPLTATLIVDGATNLQSNVTIQAAACTASLPQVNMTPVVFALQTSPVDFYDGTGKAATPGETLACGLNNATDALATSLEAAQDATTQTYQAGGPTANECFCYTTDGSQPNTATCATAATCPAASTGSTTCELVNATTGGSLGTVATVPLDADDTVNYATCVAGAAFNSVDGTGAYSVQPYTHTITVDGNTGDWIIAGQNGATLNEEGAVTSLGGKNGLGLFTYDANNLYFGFVNTGGNGTAGAPLGIQLAANDYVGILIGTANPTGAPQTIPSVALFPPTTLQVGEGTAYFVTWPLTSANGATAMVYQWSGGAWTLAGATVTAKVGTVGASSNNVFEMSIPIASLPLLGAPANQVTVMGIYATGVGTGTPATVFTWAAGAAVDDGWFNDFLQSCVAPAFKDSTVPAGVVNTNPGH